MKVAELFVRCLEAEGVKYIFGVPGEETLDLMEALQQSNIEFVVTRHETGAAFMAGMIGRLTGKPGVCLSTLGPGATNMLTGVADANMNRAPVVAITAQAGMNRQHKESHQAYDLVSLYRPVTKWSASIRTPEITAEIVHKAFQLAATEKPGATHIELPEDIARLAIDDEPIRLSYSRSVNVAATESSIHRAAALINQAERPIILCGNGVARDRAERKVQQLAERMQTPVTETFMGKGTLPSQHPLSLLATGFPGKDYIHLAFAYADLIITVGFDMVEYRPDKWNEQRTSVLHIDSLEAEVDAFYPVKHAVVGQLSTNLQRLTELLTPRNQMIEWYRQLQEQMRTEVAAMGNEQSYPIKPQRIIADIKRVLAPEDLILSDVGAHKIWMGRMYPADFPNTCLISNGLASMGYALPSALAAKMVHPERNVLAVVGDGSFLMTGMELETAVRHQLPLVVLIWRDDGYGLIQWKQLSQFQRSSYVKFGNPNFVALAESFGAIGYRVEKTEELVPTLQKALTAQQPVIIDCPVDYNENMDLTKRLSAITQESRFVE